MLNKSFQNINIIKKVETTYLFHLQGVFIMTKV
jgi:hypothetical protein